MPAAHLGCGHHGAYDSNHCCECRYPWCLGFYHVCPCGNDWTTEKRTHFVSFDVRSYAAGDPCRTRMRITWDRGRKMWRVYERAQPHQTISRHGDIWLAQWITARDVALNWIEADARRQEEFLKQRWERWLEETNASPISWGASKGEETANGHGSD
jgi:hypothetical protein